MEPERTTPTLERHVAGLMALEADLDRVSRDLSRVRNRVAATRRTWDLEVGVGEMGVAGPTPALRQPTPAVRPPAPASWSPVPGFGPPAPASGRPAPTGPAPTGPAPTGPAPTGPGPVVAPVPPPWWQRDGAMARVLSAVGAAVLLLGVTFLIVLAVQSGYFGPVPRVAAAGVVSGVLLVTGFAVYRRQPGNAGAVALVATGIAGGYLDLVGVTTIYAWVPVWVGLVLAGGVSAGGLLVARRWSSQVLAVIVVLGAVMLSPVLSVHEPWVMSAFLVLVASAAAAAQLDRDWPVLEVARVLPVALVLCVGVVVATDPGHEAELMLTAVLCTLFSLVCLGAQVWLLRRPAPSPGVTVVLIAVAAVPSLWAVVLATDGWLSVGWLGSLALLWIAVGTRVRPVGAQAVLFSLGATAVVTALADQAPGEDLVWGTLAVAAAYLAVGLALSHRAVGWVGVALGSLALFAWSPIIGPLLGRGEGGLRLEDLLASASGLVVVLLGYRFTRPVVRESARAPWVMAAWAVAVWAVGLVCVAGASVSGGVMIGRALGTVGSGFVGGHAAATLIWLGGATWLLVRSLRRTGVGRLRAGVVLAGLAVAKLLLFDLATLDGLIRVVAFVVAGTALLTLGTLFARSIRDRPLPG